MIEETKTLNKKEQITSLEESLFYKEIHMCIGPHEKIILDALRVIDDSGMSGDSTENAKFSLVVANNLINALIDSIKKGNINGQMDITTIINQQLGCFFKEETEEIKNPVT